MYTISFSMETLLECIPCLIPPICGDMGTDEFFLMTVLRLGKKGMARYKHSQRTYKEIGKNLIRQGREEDFSRFLKATKPSRVTRRAYLELCNQEHYNRFIPLIMEAENEATHGKGSASLEKGKLDL